MAGSALGPRARRGGSRHGPVPAALLAAVVTALVAALVACSPPGAAPGAAPGAGTSSPGTSASSRALQSLLDARARALLGRDRRGWLAPLVPGAWAAQQAVVLDRLGALPLTGWRWSVQGWGPGPGGAAGAALPATARTARVALVWTASGAQPVREEGSFTVVRRGRSWALAGSTGPLDPWDLGPVQVHRSARALLLGDVPAAVLARDGALVDAAAARVDAVWGTAWPRSTLVEVPATTAQLAALLGLGGDGGGDAGAGSGLDQLSAATVGAVAGAAPGAGPPSERVVLDPTGFAQLSPLGQRVVLTHELVHVATRTAARQDVPRWLSEGFADLVAYSGSGLDADQVAGDLLAQVRRSGAPTALPTDAAFDPARGDVGPAYSGAWVALGVLQHRCGAAGVVALYRGASGRAGLRAALREDCGLTGAQLVRDWRARLVALAAAPAGAPASTAPASTAPASTPPASSPPASTLPASTLPGRA